MKKFLFILCMFSSVANAEISCEDAGGTLYKGNDGKTEYCVSYHGMNWWSANAWCQSLGMELVDLETECKKKTVSIVSPAVCPQLALDVPITAWAKNTSSSSKAMIMVLRGSGGIDSAYKNNTLNAFCLVK